EGGGEGGGGAEERGAGELEAGGEEGGRPADDRRCEHAHDGDDERGAQRFLIAGAREPLAPMREPAAEAAGDHFDVGEHDQPEEDGEHGPRDPPRAALACGAHRATTATGSRAIVTLTFSPSRAPR